jgi:hypothetical protein
MKALLEMSALGRVNSNSQLALGAMAVQRTFVLSVIKIGRFL